MPCPAVDTVAALVRHCGRLGELQARLVQCACPVERSRIETEMTEVLHALHLADAQVRLLRQPHV